MTYWWCSILALLQIWTCFQGICSIIPTISFPLTCSNNRPNLFRPPVGYGSLLPAQNLSERNLRVDCVVQRWLSAYLFCCQQDMLLLSIMKLVLALPKTLYILPWCLPINCPEATTDAAQWHSWKRITTLRSLEAGSGQKGGADGVSGRANSNCTMHTSNVPCWRQKREAGYYLR